MLGVSALATVEFQALLLGSNPALALRSHFLWKDVCHHSVASVVLRAKGVACKHTMVFHVHLSHFLPKCKKCFLGFGLLYSVEMKSTLAKLSFKLGKKYTTTV